MSLALDRSPPACQPAAGASPAARRLLNATLFVTMLLSSIAFVEPSPHDALMPVLLVACVAARVRFDRKLVPLLLLLVLWLVGGLLCLVQVGDQKTTIQYAGTSIYLGFATLMFACLFCNGDLVRLAIVRRAVVLAALLAAACGYAGFFRLVPHYEMFLDYERVSATFKDPNVFGPFLIFPVLLLLCGTVERGFRPIAMLTIGILLGGLFLSFSRGAWIHFGVSAAVAVWLLYATTSDPRLRYRIVAFGLLVTIAVALIVVALASIGSVHDLLLERAKALQPYDTRRFSHQEIALNEILNHPNGLGPFEFNRIYGEQQHNVYMQAFLVYGWLGGTAYAGLVLVTLAIGFRAATVATDWQHYLIAAYAAFVGEAGEGFVVDTDHWRHFFLLLGMIWGLTAATANSYRRRRDAAQADRDAGLVPATS